MFFIQRFQGIGENKDQAEVSADGRFRAVLVSAKMGYKRSNSSPVIHR